MSIVQAAIALAAVVAFVLVAAIAVAVLIAIAQAFLPCRDEGGDDECAHFAAVARITRKDKTPDYVPSEWIEEHNQ